MGSKWDFNGIYPLVICYIAVENHHFLWENPLFLWQLSIAIFVYQRVNLMSGDWNIFYFVHSVGNVIIPSDELIVFRGVGIPPSRNISKSNFTMVYR